MQLSQNIPGPKVQVQPQFLYQSLCLHYISTANCLCVHCHVFCVHTVNFRCWTCISALSTLFCLCRHTVNFLCLTCRFFCVHTQPIFSAHAVNFLCLTCYLFYMNTFFCVHIDRHTLHIFRIHTVNFSAYTFFCVQPRIFSVCIHCQLLRVHTTANFNVYTYYQFWVFSPSPQKICVQTAT